MPPNTSGMPATYETLDYNIVEDMKKARTIISIFELTRITSQRELLVRALVQPSSSENASSSQKVSGKSSGPLELVVNDVTLEDNTLCPPFSLTFTMSTIV